MKRRVRGEGKKTDGRNLHMETTERDTLRAILRHIRSARRTATDSTTIHALDSAERVAKTRLSNIEEMRRRACTPPSHRKDIQLSLSPLVPAPPVSRSALRVTSPLSPSMTRIEVSPPPRSRPITSVRRLTQDNVNNHYHSPDSTTAMRSLEALWLSL